MNLGSRITMVLIAALLLSSVTPVWSEDVEKKFRVSLSVGGLDTQDQIASESANELLLLNDDEIAVNLLRDPRNDSGVFGQLKIEPTARIKVTGQYAFTKTFLLEASVGYQKGDVGDIEVQAQFSGVRPPDEQPFVFEIFRVPAGEMEQVPIQLTAINRFRPRAKFNPFIGAGIGYTLVGFDPSPQLNELSTNMDASLGGFSPGSAGSVINPGALTGADVEAQDTFEMHLTGGAELTIKPKWVLYVDFRYSWSSRAFSIGFNGQDSLGIPVPQGQEFLSELQNLVFGGFNITTGGLFDGGSLQPAVGSPAGTDCAVEPTLCEFIVGANDGELDAGIYYVEGGKIDYDSASLQIGVRYTF